MTTYYFICKISEHVTSFAGKTSEQKSPACLLSYFLCVCVMWQCLKVQKVFFFMCLGRNTQLPFLRIISLCQHTSLQGSRHTRNQAHIAKAPGPARSADALEPRTGRLNASGAILTRLFVTPVDEVLQKRNQFVFT